ncbi:MAG: PQQ-binding-like beta-propeller repeat protein [Armatimonadota bacterium]|nr:PQQ-binding-like beta-propeller repeat protein [bacterium]
MKHFGRFIAAFIIFCGIIASQLPANAGAYLYSGKRKRINCGVLVVSGSTSENTNLFMLLDNLSSMKPAGWTFENPLAGFNGSRKYTKNENDYWLINLRDARDLSMMHVLYLGTSGVVALTDEDREKLREFVDNGGVLWIDNTGGFKGAKSSIALQFDKEYPFFISNFIFKSIVGAYADYPISPHHPLLSMPYWISEQEVGNLGAYSIWGSMVCEPGYDGDAMKNWNLPPSQFDMLFPVVGNNGSANPSIAANAYGSGRIVATANDVGAGCFANYPYNLASLKFAYNVVAWSSTWTHLRKGPRHTGASIDTVGGTKLANLWTLNSASASNSVESAPVIYKNMAFYSSGSTVYAIDLAPQEDLDQDGYPDDGKPNTSTTGGADVIWEFSGDGTLSSPSIVTVQDPGDFSKAESSVTPVDVVLVQSSTGTIYMLDAFKRVSGKFPSKPDVLTTLSGPASSNPFPPLYSNGWIYAIGSDGRLNAFNPVLKAWKANHSGDTTVTPYWSMPNDIWRTSEVHGGLTFGFLKHVTSGAIIGVVYWCAPEMIQGSTLVGNDCVYGVPVFVNNDRLKVTNISGSVATCKAIYSKIPISGAPLPQVWIIKNNGEVIKATAEVDPALIGVLKVTTTTSETIPIDAKIYANYSLTYATEGIIYGNPPEIKCQLQPQPPTISDSSLNPVSKTIVTATPALGPDGLMFVNGKRDSNSNGQGTTGGSIYAMKCDGTLRPTKWNYLLHEGVRNTALMGSSGSGLPSINTASSDLVIPGVVMVELPNGMMAPMTNIQAQSSPAYWGDKLFVTVNGSVGDTSMGALLCFKANPDFVIRITQYAGVDGSGNPVKKTRRLYDSADPTRKLTVRLWQPNLLTPGGGSILTDSVAVTGEDMVDYERGIIHFDSFDRPKLKGSIDGTGLSILETNIFSPSLPVWVTLDGVEVPIDWSTWSPINSQKDKLYAGATNSMLDSQRNDSVDLSGWNNLLWYYPVSKPVHSSPVLIGDGVYFTADDDTIYAVNAETGETAGKAVDDSQLIWKEDGSYTGESSSGGEYSGPNISIAGSNGVLLVPKRDGLVAYSNTTTLTADTSRVMEIDGAGEISWSLDSVSWPGRIPLSSSNAAPKLTSPVNNPGRVRYIAQNDLLMANTGANQVCRFSKDGTVSFAQATDVDDNKAYVRWMYDKFSDPRHLLRPGQPTTLDGPTDALLWEETEVETINSKDVNVSTVHCMIADSGNHRIVDLVYRLQVNSNGKRTLLNKEVDPDSGFTLPDLRWITNTDSMNDRYIYDCIQLAPTPNYSGIDVCAAVSNYRAGLDPSSGVGLGGAIVAIKYRERSGNRWVYNANKSGEIEGSCDQINFSGSIMPLASPRYFQIVSRTSINTYTALVCDNYGVYEAEISLDSRVAMVTHKLWDEDYRGLDRDGDSDNGNQYLGVPLLARSAQKLPNDNWLITNSYSGTNKGGTATFNGEVFEYNPNITTGSTTAVGKVGWHCPDLKFTFPKEDPANYDWKQVLTNSYTPQQPRSAERLSQ